MTDTSKISRLQAAAPRTPMRTTKWHPSQQYNQVVENKLNQRIDNSRKDVLNEENNVAMNVVLRNTARYELAHQFCRETISLLQKTPYYRHKAKQYARELLKQIAKYDNEVGSRFVGDDKQLEVLDGMAEYFINHPEVKRRANVLKFSIMQFLTRNGGRENELVATATTAAYITNYTYNRLRIELDKAEFINPRLSTMRSLLRPQELNAIQNLSILLSDDLFQRDYDTEEMYAQSPDIVKALDNLTAFLNNPQTIDPIIRSYFKTISKVVQQ